MGPFTTAAFRFSLLGLFAATAACASASPTLSVRERFLAALDSLGYDTTQAAGPRVAISTESEALYTRRITPRIHVAEDAYVAVVNVWPSGDVSVVWPDSPEDDGFLPGGRTYAVPSMFSGFATVFPPTGAQGLRFVRFARSSDARFGTRGPGYVVVIASHAPLDLVALDTAGYFDDVTTGSDLRAMEPAAVIPRLAVLAGRGSTALTLDHARYGGYDVLSVASQSSAFPASLASRSTCRSRFGYHLSPALTAWDAAYGVAGCGMTVYDEIQARRWSLPRLPLPPRDTTLVPSDSLRPKPDTLSRTDRRSAEVRAVWSALMDQTAARVGTREFVDPEVLDHDVMDGEVVEVPGSRERQALEQERGLRTMERPAVDDVRRQRRGAGRPHSVDRPDRAPERVVPDVPRREVARPEPPPRAQPEPRRADPAPRHVEPAPRHVEPAPGPQPPARPRGGDPEPKS